MPDLAAIEDFLAQPRLAFVGASRNPKEFANAVYREMRAHGHAMTPVHTQAVEIEGDRCAAGLGALPGPVDGVVVMLPPNAALRVVHEAIDAGIPRVWLHRGVGTSSVSDEAVQYCRDHGVAVVDGACPLMFLEPVGWFHRMHRGICRMRGDFKAAA